MSSCGIFVHSIGISFDDREQILQPRHERLRRLALKRRTCSLFLPTILPCALLREVIYNVAQLDIAICICNQLLFHATPAAAAAAAASSGGGGGGSSMRMNSSSKAAASRALVRSLGDMLPASPYLQGHFHFLLRFFCLNLHCKYLLGSRGVQSQLW